MTSKTFWKNAAKAVTSPTTAVVTETRTTRSSETWQNVWAAAAAVAMGASAYHGYKRNEQGNNPILWGLWWGFWGALLPIITVPVAIAQGFGKPASPPEVLPEAAGYGALPMQVR